MNTLPLFPQDDNPVLKKCSKCPEEHQWHPATSEFFHKDKDTKDGFRPHCKSCRKAYNELNKDKIQTQRKARQPKSTEWMREYRKGEKWQKYAKDYRIRYAQENKEAINERSTRYSFAHKEEKAEYQRRYLQTEKGRLVDKAKRHKRRAQKLSSEGSYTSAQLQDQLKRQKHKCYWCGNKLGKDKGVWHADHIIPLARGGSNSIDNIVCACPTCNMHKHDKLPHEWSDGGRLL